MEDHLATRNESRIYENTRTSPTQRRNIGIGTIPNLHAIAIIIGIMISIIGGQTTYIPTKQLAPIGLSAETPIQLCQLKDNRFYTDKMGKTTINNITVLWTSPEKLFVIPQQQPNSGTYETDFKSTTGLSR